MTTLGIVHDITEEFYFKWEIDDFFSLPEEDGKKYPSPSFSFGGESWHLEIYPHGQSKNNSVGYIDVYLSRNLPGPPFSVVCSLGIKICDGKRDVTKQFTYVYQKAIRIRGFRKLFRRSILSKKRSELVPSDVLTIVCKVDYCFRSIVGAGKSVKYRKNSFILY